MISYEIKGNLFSGDLLEDLSSRQGQSASDFNLSAGIRVSDEASRIFGMARAQWANFRQAIERLHPEQTGVSETRNLWVIPLLSFLGYELQFVRSEEVEGANFRISHRDALKDGFPVHIIGYSQSLDENPDSSRGNRDSAHVQMQEYLNHTEHLYGIITNGYKLRLLRDHHRLTGMQYLEWDLEAMMVDSDLVSFTMLYRMLQVSRIPKRMGDDSLLEQYHQHSVEEGNRVRDKLKTAVYTCLKLLGNGFLKHPGNEELRKQLSTGALSAISYGQYLRTLVYRLLFLFVAEDRNLVFQPESDPASWKLYRDHYSLHRFRMLAETYLAANPRHGDVWEQLKATFRLFEEEGTGQPLGIAPLGGELFKPGALGALQSAGIDNRTLLKALDLLSRFEQEKSQRIRINYRRINVEEFGAVYESLLELNPEIDLEVVDNPFQYIDGESRKGTGSYYTHQDLVKQVLKTALEPVVRERLAEAEQGVTDMQERRRRKEAALLNLSVCDSACGSGHFLVTAARALATELAYLRAPRGASVDSYERAALRDVIEHCIYGVDVNPDAVELCRLVLWMEAHEAGRPLTYLDHKIRCGNSLVGWLGPDTDPEIPDEAFAALPGDKNSLVRSYQKRNNTARHLRQHELELDDDRITWQRAADRFTELTDQPIVTLNDYWRKQQAYIQWRDQPEVAFQRLKYNAWTYAFFQSYSTTDTPVISQRELKQLSESGDLDEVLKQAIEKEAKASRFFHWPLEFPQVFERGGFAVLLGNPPWGRIKLQEKKFFTGRKPEIANATNAAIRKKLIAALDPNDLHLLAFEKAKLHANQLGRYLRTCGYYNLTNSGDINTYSVFSERILSLVEPSGRAGIIVPTGIATDYTNRNFFAHLVEAKRLASLYDFENRKALFREVHRMFKCSLVTLVGEQAGQKLQPQFAFYLQQVSDLNDPQRVFELTREDFLRINPNTRTCPVFRTTMDAGITKGIYERVSVIEREGESPWGLNFIRMFDMAIDAKYFQYRLDFYQVEKQCKRLYEAKMFWHYNHRFNSYKSMKDRDKGVRSLERDEQCDPSFLNSSFYYVNTEVVKRRMEIMMSGYNTYWFLGFRGVSSGTNARTFISTVLPDAAFGHTCLLIRSDDNLKKKRCALIANLSAIVFDYVCRQKLGATTVAVFLVKQLPVVSPEQYTDEELEFIVPRVMELTYTAWDLKYFADDVWKDADPFLRELIAGRWTYNKQQVSIPGHLEASFERPDWVDAQEDEFPYSPFRWDEAHRHRVQCELDAFFAYKYGLSKKELQYILDPQEVYGADFPGETFRVLKEKEIRQYKEYRTRRLVLEAWENKPWERPEELPDAILGKQERTQKRNYAKIRTMPPVMARIIQRYENPRYARLLGRTKMEKLLHLIEAETGLDFGRMPEKHHFGPADLVALDEAVSLGKTQNAFIQVQKNPRRPEAGYYYERLEDFETLLVQFESGFNAQQLEIDRIIDLFAPLDRTGTELRATVYAAWNNLLIAGRQVDDESIILESCQWSDKKQEKFLPADFVEPLKWLRENDLVPKGMGKLVEAL